MTREQMEEIARGNVERNLGNVCSGEETPDALFDEIYTLAFDALADAGVEHRQARAVAERIAEGMVQL